MEDEFHFLMICKEYQAERIKFYTKAKQVIVPFQSLPSREQFIFLMSTNDTKVLIACRFDSPQGDNQGVLSLS